MANPFDEFDTTSTPAVTPSSSPSNPFDQFDPPKPPRTLGQRLTEPFTDIGPEIANEASDAWKSAKANFTAPGEDRSLGTLWETAKGMGNVARAAMSPITGTARSVAGHAIADIAEGQQGLENVADPYLKQWGKPFGYEPPVREHVPYEDLYGASKTGVDTALALTPLAKGRPPVQPPPLPPRAPFGVVLSEGETTGNMAARQAEQAGIRGQLGPEAQEHAQAFFRQQRPEQVAESREIVARQLDPTGNQVLAHTPGEAAETVQSALQAENTRSKAGVTDLYNQAKALPGEIDAHVFSDMPQNIKTNLWNRPDRVIVDDNTPVASRMINYLNREIGELNITNRAMPQSTALAGQGPAPIVGVNLEGIDQWRKNLSRMRGESFNNPADSRAASAVIHEFDNMVTQAVNSGAFRGDPRAVQLFNDARAAHTQRMQIWGNDAAGKRLQQIIGDPSRGKDPAILNDVANYLYSSSGTAANSLNVGVVRRIQRVLGVDSPEWASLKQGLFRKLVNEPDPAVQTGPGGLSTRITKFLSNSDMANALFAPSEQQMLREYGQLHRTMSIPLEGANWSNTATGTIPTIRKAADKVIAMIGALIGHHISPVLGTGIGYGAGKGVASLLNATENARNARQMAAQMPIVARQLQQWQRATAAVQRLHNSSNNQRLTYATTQLVNTLGRIGVDPSAVARVLAEGVQGPGTSQAEPQRASGGRINTDVDGFSDALTNEPDRDIAKMADGGVPDDNSGATPGGVPIGPNGLPRVVIGPAQEEADKAHELLSTQNDRLPAPTDDSYVNNAILPEAPDYRSDIVKSLGETPVSEGNLAVNRATNRVMGMQPGEERYQLWPEKVLRSGLSLAHDVYTGEEPSYVTDETTGEQVINPHVVERSLDMAGLAGSGGVGGVGEGASSALGSSPFLRPALKYEGKIYKAPVGGQHLDALPTNLRDTYMRQALNGDDISNFDFGFMNHKGQFMNREGAMDYAIQNGMVDSAAARQGALTTDVALRSDTSEPGAVVAGLAKSQSPFYSAVEQAVTSAKQTKMQGDQWANWLKNQPGVKPDELQYTGVDSWLRGQKGPVNKEQVQDYLNQNKVQLQDVVRGKKEIDPAALNQAIEDHAGHLVDRFFYEEGRNPNSREMQYIREQAHEDVMAQPEEHLDNRGGEPLGTRYHDWTLPGGENYREHLITLPSKAPLKIEPVTATSHRLVDTNTGKMVAQGTPEEMQARLREMQPWAQGVAERSGNTPYKSSHWEEPNILAHARTNERDVGGVSSHHIEEIQSDWHQAGRKQGYAYSPDEAKVAQKRANEIIEKDNPTPEEKQEYTTIMNNMARPGVPDAPFKKDWAELALKRQIRQAVEEGKSRVSWTPGEAQAARYDLSRHINSFSVVPIKDNGAISELVWHPSTRNGSLGSFATDLNGKVLRAHSGFGDAVGKGADELVGKDFAKKVLDDFKNTAPKEGAMDKLRAYRDEMDQKYGSPPFNKMDKDEIAHYYSLQDDLANETTHAGDRNYSGVDLKVGGEGMKGFYDNMLPKMAEKIGKQYGVKVKKSAVEGAGDVGSWEGNVNSIPPSRIYNALPELRQQYPDIADFVDHYNNLNTPQRAGLINKAKSRSQKGQTPVWYFDIPEKMKNDVLSKGFPMFSDTGVAAPVSANEHKEKVSRPVQHEQDETEVNAPKRAAGGRVLASNIDHSPSESQKHAGNYSKDHVHIHGLDLTIENAKGKHRSGVGPDGKPWKAKLGAHYGYIKRTEGADGDHVDVFLGPSRTSKHVFVINQQHLSEHRRPGIGSSDKNAFHSLFDEHKVMMGFSDIKQALKAYEASFSDGKALHRIASIIPTDMAKFKHWLREGKTQKPFALN